jgi:hypothetical protein
MSQSIRQNNLFAAEDWRKIYKAFTNVNFVSYDFETIRRSLIEYLRLNYPEDFNDYIESSEFIAIVDLLAWLGESLAFRVDLNVRENFFDTAERRQSILRLARFLSYKPKRNLAAKGFLKIVGVQTNDDIFDSNGTNLNGIRIDWNDPNNPDWFEQFILVLNNAFSNGSKFGHPVQRGTDTSNVRVEVYQLNTVDGENPGVYSFNANIDGESLQFENVNVSFSELEGYKERSPDFFSKFHILYKKDGRGNNSSSTGFFTFFKQGSLLFSDFNITIPLENRTLDINKENINNEDVFVQTLDEDGTINTVWTKVPDSVIQNIIFNDIPITVRNIFSVETRDNDQITIRFGDGRFGAVPFGRIRVYYRTSYGDKLVIRPRDISNVGVSINYVNSAEKNKTLTLYLSLEEPVTNSAPAESVEEIRKNAPQVYYSQNRMVNAEDYNSLPLSHQNIRKLKAINRTYAGHSRFIDIKDPTGSHNSVKVLGNDGILFKEKENTEIVIENFVDLTNEEIFFNHIFPLFSNIELRDFIIDALKNNAAKLPMYSSLFEVPPAFGVLGQIMWDRISGDNVSSTGRFVDSALVSSLPIPQTVNALAVNLSFPAGNSLDLVKSGSMIKFKEAGWTGVVNVIDNGKGVSEGFLDAGTGKIFLSRSVKEGDIVEKILPKIRTELNSFETSSIISRLSERNTFGLYYDFTTDAWKIIEPPNITGFDLNSDFTYDNNARKWMVLVTFNSPSTMTVTFRGLRHVFESKKDVRFFFTQKTPIVDNEGNVKQDIITVNRSNTSPSVVNENPTAWVSGISYTMNSLVIFDNTIYKAVVSATTSSYFNNTEWLSICPGLEKDSTFCISDTFRYPDGYEEPRKVIVTYCDSNLDTFIDDPDTFDRILIENSTQPPPRLFWRKFVDIDGLEHFEPIEIQKIFIENTLVSAITKMDQYYINTDTRTLWVDKEIVYCEGTSDKQYEFFLFEIDNVYLTGDIIPGGLNVGLAKVPSAQKILDKNNFLIRRGRKNLTFLWEHVTPFSNVSDPSISNIIDIFVLDKNYDDLVRQWIQEETDEPQPLPPTQAEMKITYSELEKLKMISDEIIWNPVEYVILFGDKALEELQATFKVIKTPNASLSDGEIKTRIIDLINRFFDIENWDFGETFYFTELAAFIHQNLVSEIASIVIVPKNAESVFGNLFEIRSKPNQLFLPHVTRKNIDIIETNSRSSLRIRG